LEITLDKTSKTQAFIKIKLIEEDYQPIVEEKVKEYVKKAQIKGFRPGKVPPALIRKMYGKSIIFDEVNNLLSKNLQQYISTNELNVLGDPMPTLDTTFDLETMKEFEFKYELGLAEEFDIKGIDEKLVLDAVSLKVDKATIDESIENMKDQMGEMTNPETCEIGDSLYGVLLQKELDLEKNISLELSELKDKEAKKMVGKKSEDQIEFSLIDIVKEDTYASNLTGKTKEELASVTEKFTFTVKNVNRIVPAEINQEMFDKVFGKDIVKTEEEFESKIKESIGSNYEVESNKYNAYLLKKKILDKVTFEIPVQFLKDWLLRSNEGKFTSEQIEKEFEYYERDLRWSLIKNKIAKEADLKVENVEVIEGAKDQIKQQLAASNIPLEYFADKLDEFADRYLKEEKGENYMKIFNQILDSKVINQVKNKITTKSKTISVDEFKKLEMN
jgi:trigger factor